LIISERKLEKFCIREGQRIADEIVDKLIPRILDDDGSSVNIMPTAKIMDKLGLQVSKLIHLILL